MTIYLIRHAQSEFNAAFRSGLPDPMIFDAQLSELGREQALKARAHIANLDIEKLIVSPLTRTLQTAEIMFQKKLPTQVNSLVREQLSHSGDVGTSPAQLSRDWAHLDFEHLGDPWWHVGQNNHLGFCVEPLELLEKRAEEFVGFAKQMKLHSTAIVTHGNFIRVLSGIQPENCQIIKLDI